MNLVEFARTLDSKSRDRKSHQLGIVVQSIAKSAQILRARGMRVHVYLETADGKQIVDWGR